MKPIRKLIFWNPFWRNPLRKESQGLIRSYTLIFDKKLMVDLSLYSPQTLILSILQWWVQVERERKEKEERLRHNILSLVVLLRLLKFRLGNGRPLIWNSWLIFRRLGDNMTPYGLIWTAWLSLPTSSLWSLLKEPRIIRDSTLMRLWDGMGFLCLSF